MPENGWSDPGVSMQSSERDSLIRGCRIHAVTDSEAIEAPDFENRARVLAGSGLAALSLRAGSLSGRQLYEIALRLREITREAGVPLIINSRLDVALAVKADFVHLGFHSVPLEAASGVCREHGLAFGYSCHNLEQVELALKHGASYLYLGTIFATGSKPGVKPAGIGLVQEICSQVKGVPVFAIGGMTPETAPLLAQAGAFGCAAVSALWRAEDPLAVLSEMCRAFC